MQTYLLDKSPVAAPKTRSMDVRGADTEALSGVGAPPDSAALPKRPAARSAALDRLLSTTPEGW